MTKPYIARLEDQIRKIAALMLQNRIKDPRLGFVTITDVRLTGDGRQATIFYTDLGQRAIGGQGHESEDQIDTPAALEAAKGQIRTAVGKQLKLKFAPTLTFVPDVTDESGAQMEKLLDQVAASDAWRAANANHAQPAGEADPYRSSDK